VSQPNIPLSDSSGLLHKRVEKDDQDRDYISRLYAEAANSLVEALTAKHERQQKRSLAWLRSSFGRSVGSAVEAKQIRGGISQLFEQFRNGAIAESVAKFKSKTEQALDLKMKASVRQPKTSFTDFHRNRPIGDWAEDLIQRELPSILGDACILGCGAEASEEPIEIKPAQWAEEQKELDEWGKRPDFVLFSSNARPAEFPPEFRKLRANAQSDTIRMACAAIEVRSSRRLLQQFLEHHKGKPEKGLSFAVKVEDLRLVARWIIKNGIRHFYMQVCLDAVYAIPFERALQLIKEKKYLPKKLERNQGKSTIYIPLSEGFRIGDVIETKYEPAAQFMADGRLISPEAPIVGSGKIKATMGLDDLRKTLALD